VLSRNRKTFAVPSLVLNLFASQIGEFFLPHPAFVDCNWIDTRWQYTSQIGEFFLPHPAFVDCNWIDTRWQYTFTYKQYTEHHNEREYTE